MTYHSKVTLKDLNTGSMFLYNGTYALKTEYVTKEGAIEAYIVGSGEFFWGGTNNPKEQNELKVVPITL